MPSIEEILLSRAYPHVLASRRADAVRRELEKGCQGMIVDEPVQLEPAYRLIRGIEDWGISDDTIQWIPDTPVADDEMIRLSIWISPEQQCEWNRSELFLKQLSCVHHRVAFEMLGNRERIAFQILCHRDDAPIVRAAFSGQFERCTLSLAGDADILRSVPAAAWADTAFYDFYPSPPYSHLMTRPEELQRSPYTSLITSLARAVDPAIGFSQVVFAPVSVEHNWHRNVRSLLDLEYMMKQASGLSVAQQYGQQTPSAPLHGMATDVEFKSHNDKPFFAVAFRVGVIDGPNPSRPLIDSLAAMRGLIQHGGRPLNALTDDDYRPRLSADAIRRMFTTGLVHRTGFLVNSEELTSLVHIPPPKQTEHLQTTMDRLETLPAADALATGTPIGECLYADTRQQVCIPPDLRGKHTHAIGGTGTGKSTLLEAMVLHDVGQGHGVALLDPHGRLVERLLCLIPEEYVDRVIHFDPGDPDWVPIWNPLRCGVTMSRDRIADDLVGAFKSFFSGWGDRLEHLLRHAFFGVLHLPNGNLLDASNLLRKKSDESRRLRSQLLHLIDNEVSRTFWQEDFGGYGQADLTPPQHKLSKLLASETVGAMLSQGDSAFSFRDVMDTGKVLLIDLSNTGSEVRNILGCFILSLLHLTALTRSNRPGHSHRPFHIYCDEAHRFLTDAMEDLIAETRKFNVSLTLAHQYMRQFNAGKGDALSGVGSTIIFKVDSRDAQHLLKDLQGKVILEDLSSLEVGQAIARIGNDVVRVRTRRPLDPPEHHFRDQIIARSRELYCRPAEEVIRAIRDRRTKQAGSGVLWVPPSAETGSPRVPEVQPTAAEPRHFPSPADLEAFRYEAF